MADLSQDIRQARDALLECYDNPDHKARVTKAFEVGLNPYTLAVSAQQARSRTETVVYEPIDQGYMAEDPVHWELYVQPDKPTIWRRLEFGDTPVQTQGRTVAAHPGPPGSADEDRGLLVVYRDNQLVLYRNLLKQQVVLERAVNGLDTDPDRELITREFRGLLQSDVWKMRVQVRFASYPQNMQRGAVFIALANEFRVLSPPLVRRVAEFYRQCADGDTAEALAAALASNAKYLPPELRALNAVKRWCAVHQLTMHRFADLPDATKIEIARTYFETELQDKIQLIQLLAPEYADLSDDLQQDAFIVLMAAPRGILHLHPNVPRDFVIRRRANVPVGLDPLHAGEPYQRFLQRWRAHVEPLAIESRLAPSAANTADLLRAMQDLRNTLESPERPVPPQQAMPRRNAAKRLRMETAFADLAI